MVFWLLPFVRQSCLEISLQMPIQFPTTSSMYFITLYTLFSHYNNLMINDQLARILQSKPESLISAIQSNNQQLIHLETLIEERGKQVASLQFILSNEVGLVDKVINARGRMGQFQGKISDVTGELTQLKVYVKEEISKAYGELIGEIAKVFKEFCIDKKQREEEIKGLKEEILRLNEEIKLRSQDILHIDQEQSLEEEMRGRHSRIPMLETDGYTLGNESLKELFSPMGEQTLSLSEIRVLKEIHQGNTSGNLKQGKGQTLYEKGYMFKGGFKNGQRHGFGELILKDQVVYRGDWKRDVFWGKGTLQLRDVSTVYENAVTYMGNFENGDFQGLGVIEFQDGSRFTTEFSQGKVSSPGILSKNQYMSILGYDQSSISIDPICTK